MAIRVGRSPLSGIDSSPVKLELAAATPSRERLWNLLPITLSVFLATSVLWGPYTLPGVFAVSIVAFFGYWLIRSYSVAVSCIVGLRRMKAWEATSWLAKYCEWLPAHPQAPQWSWPRHMIIIPNYKESEEGLSRTIDSLAAQANREQLVVVLAMEDREPGAHEKASRLVARYRPSFGDIFATFHPGGIAGETSGKGSNEAWAAREARVRIIEERGQAIERFTVTSCDADAVFHPRHFEALNFLFLTAPDRYRTFWQPTIFNSNNIWDIPAPLRMPDGLSGINRLSNLVMPGSVKFPTSCYATSWSLLDQIDYWDEEVIPEDWHVYLKACYTLGDRVHVDALYLPLGNDCVLADGYIKTLKAHYTQSVRHAWGASDIPFAWRAASNHASPLSSKRKVLLASAVTKVHALWMAQWYLVTLGVLLPAKLAGTFNAPMPHWWTHRYYVPGMGWHPENIIHPFQWFAGGKEGLIEPTMGLNIPGMLVAVCLFPLIAMIVIEYRARGPRPAYVSRFAAIRGFVVWPLMAVITFFFASLPALHAQLKLAKGTGLVYHVAEKGQRRVPASASMSAHVSAMAEPMADPIGAAGGGGGGA